MHKEKYKKFIKRILDVRNMKIHQRRSAVRRHEQSYSEFSLRLNKKHSSLW